MQKKFRLSISSLYNEKIEKQKKKRRSIQQSSQKKQNQKYIHQKWIDAVAQQDTEGFSITQALNLLDPQSQITCRRKGGFLKRTWNQPKKKNLIKIIKLCIFLFLTNKKKER